jgi:hypothetical protein
MIEVGDRLIDQAKNLVYDVTEVTVYGVKLVEVEDRNSPATPQKPVEPAQHIDETTGD